MFTNTPMTAAFAALLLSPLVSAGLYSKNSPVLQVEASSYNRLIAKSNHTSIVEFYAPWCGHCKNLAPQYEKAAKRLQGLAKVAAINCDEDSNKAFCSQMGVKGYPTLKIVRPSKRKGGKPLVEDYQSERSTKAIVDAVVEKIPNHVKRISDKSLEAWLKESNETAKAVLFTEKGTTSALLRALAIDFLGSVNFGQIKNKEKEAVDTFGIENFPTFLVLPGGDADPVVYDGELKKENMREFVAKFAEPNLDPPPIEKKKQPIKKEGDKIKESTVKDGDKAKESTENKKKKESPVALIPTLDEAQLKTNCLSSTSKVCLLLLLPEKQKEPSPKLLEAMVNFLETHDKHSRRPANFPFYIIEATNPSSKLLRETLGLKDLEHLEAIAVNAKRMWWRHYAPGEEEGYSRDGIEAWVDTIKMNEGKREILPNELVKEMNDDDEEGEDADEKGNVVEESATTSAASGQEEKLRDEL